MNGNNIQKPTKFDMKLHRQNLEKLLVIYDNNLNKWVNVDRREGQWVGMGFDDNVDPVPVFGKTEENIREKFRDSDFYSILIKCITLTPRVINIPTMRNVRNI